MVSRSILMILEKGVLYKALFANNKRQQCVQKCKTMQKRGEFMQTNTIVHVQGVHKELSNDEKTFFTVSR